MKHNGQTTAETLEVVHVCMMPPTSRASKNAQFLILLSISIMLRIHVTTNTFYAPAHSVSFLGDDLHDDPSPIR